VLRTRKRACQSPNVKHMVGGMVFPKKEIDEIKKQEGRDIARFDVEFDLPDNGSYTISSDRLASLPPGPLWIIVRRFVSKEGIVMGNRRYTMKLYSEESYVTTLAF